MKEKRYDAPKTNFICTFIERNNSLIFVERTAKKITSNRVLIVVELQQFHTKTTDIRLRHALAPLPFPMFSGTLLHIKLKPVT